MPIRRQFLTTADSGVVFSASIRARCWTCSDPVEMDAPAIVFEGLGLAGGYLPDERSTFPLGIELMRASVNYQRSHLSERARGRQSGFSMLELVVAIAILLVSTLAAFASQVKSHELMDSSRDSASAMTDLEVCIEELLTRTADEMPVAFPPGDSVPGYDDLHLPAESIVPQYPGFVAGGAVPDPLEIVLTATWNDGRGRPQRATLATIKTR